MDIKEKFYKDISFLTAGKYMTTVILELSDKLKTPSEISKSAKIPMREISRALQELKKHNLVVVLNEKAKKGRVYKLTEKGKSILKYI